MEHYLYHYRAVVVSVYDGDTIRVDVDLGLRSWRHRERIRLARINAPEIRGAQRPAGLAARDFLRELLEGREILLQTIKDRTGKYGRYLGEIWLKQDSGDYLNVNDLLVEKGHAEYATY